LAYLKDHPTNLSIFSKDITEIFETSHCATRFAAGPVPDGVIVLPKDRADFDVERTSDNCITGAQAGLEGGSSAEAEAESILRVL
jgi:hypothetical protein